jgi:hypothetical protein
MGLKCSTNEGEEKSLYVIGGKDTIKETKT